MKRIMIVDQKAFADWACRTLAYAVQFAKDGIAVEPSALLRSGLNRLSYELDFDAVVDAQGNATIHKAVQAVRKTHLAPEELLEVIKQHLA